MEGLYDDFLILEFFVSFGGLSVVDLVAVSHLPVAVNCLHNLNVFDSIAQPTLKFHKNTILYYGQRFKIKKTTCVVSETELC